MRRYEHHNMHDPTTSDMSCYINTHVAAFAATGVASGLPWRGLLHLLGRATRRMFSMLMAFSHTVSHNDVRYVLLALI